MLKCSASWYELNISAPDNIVSACCYYSGAKDPWLDEPVDIARYWNSKHMQEIRRINSGKVSKEPNGCSDCFYFVNRTSGAAYYDFSQPMPADLSEHQAANWKKAADDWRGGRVVVQSTPLRIYVNFGFTCNLACTMCHQVPRRGENRRQVKADVVLAWPEALRSALDVTVIGGEPFALPEAISFIRRFIADPEFEQVQLTICTNGTVHHKYWNLLKQKRKLSMTISLDSIGPGFEKIRVKGKWLLVEKNILDFLHLSRTERPDWTLQTNALILKTGIPLLPEFAEWHARHGITTSFYDFINSRGTEDTFFRENVLFNPHVLADMPEWENYFARAISTFRKAGLSIAADTLDHYRTRLSAAVTAEAQAPDSNEDLRGVNAWESVFAAGGPMDSAISLYYGTADGSVRYEADGRSLKFTKTSMGDELTTPFAEVKVAKPGTGLRLVMAWKEIKGDQRPVHSFVQDQAGREISVRRRFASTKSGSQETLIGRIGPESTTLRLVFRPVGDGESRMPDEVRLDIEASGVERLQERAGHATAATASNGKAQGQAIWIVHNFMKKALGPSPPPKPALRDLVGRIKRKGQRIVESVLSA